MRKKTMVILMTAAVLALTGCGDKTDKDAGKDEKKQETSVDAEKPDEQTSEEQTPDEAVTPGEVVPEIDTVGPAAEEEQISESDGRKLMETAAAFTKSLIAGSHEDLVNNYEYEDEMKAIVDNKELEQSINASVQASGEFKGTKAAWLGDQAGDYTNVQVPCEFSDQSWNMSISFTSDGKIGGVHTDMYKETP